MNPPISNREIAKRLNRSPQTIHTEVKDGIVRQIHCQVQNGKTYEYESFCYSATAGQEAYERARRKSRRQPKWVYATDFMIYADYQMKVNTYSPDNVVGRAKRNDLFPHEDIHCKSTVYNYINLCLMETRNIDLHLKVRRKPNKAKHRKNKKILGDSNEKRSEAINKRERFGDWEIDTVIGLKDKQDQVLLTLVERKTRYEVIVKIHNKSSKPVDLTLTAIKDAVGSNFPLVFKSIISNNGAEFSGLSSLLKHITDVYFAHPYSPWERGTNEHHNGIIRRFIPKGKRISTIPEATIERIQGWMNNLPRKILGYATPQECLLEELSKIRDIA